MQDNKLYDNIIIFLKHLHDMIKDRENHLTAINISALHIMSHCPPSQAIDATAF